ncbi:AraC family transcriptional regulator [Atopomonas sediminilitoris]|uniref:AraC family transcriptional regulator n=1 Tax=Atopomonas sediminilitoris TaxID=2919919 RepID=UPI001F4E8778|nr:AraC family transcriptional regulator [Atopomonas sediminilitoris]MCJ8168700.1 AraC family transcriptional regulator [Atopomonas sediminilitoris]
MHTPQAWLQPALHPVYARLLCAELRRRQFSQAQILQGTRLEWTRLHTESQQLSYEQMRRLVMRALALTQCPWLGVLVGQQTPASAHGALGYAAASSATLGEALLLMQRYSALRIGFARFDFNARVPGELFLIETLALGSLREYLLGQLVSGFLRFLEGLIGQPLRDHIVLRWPFAEPANSEPYRALAVHTEFAAETLSAQLPVGLLQQPCMGADASTLQLALRQCEHQRQRLEQGGSLSERVRLRLLRCDGSYPTLEDMANREHMSARILIRHLHEEHVTYQQLLDEVRAELACWLLGQRELSVQRIAEQLGYQDASNFSRCFRRWLGQTPRDYQQSLPQ